MKDPAFLFYPGDWLGGTMGMSFEQKGCYMELLIYQFNNEKFTEQEAKHILSICFDHAWPMLIKKFFFDGEFYFNKRLKEEIEKRRLYTESRKSNGSKPKNKNKNTEAYAKHIENENINENIGLNGVKKGNAKGEKIKIDFDLFWNIYDKKVGDKMKCEKKWNKLSLSDQEKIISTLPLFIEQFSNKQFQPYPETYLNQERWNDDLTIKTECKVIQQPQIDPRFKIHRATVQ